MVEKQGWTYVSRPSQILRGAHEKQTDITSIAFSKVGCGFHLSPFSHVPHCSISLAFKCGLPLVHHQTYRPTGEFKVCMSVQAAAAASIG
jgi:hypothetical protein